uniref:F-box domain-containing protein n=1 Tax=Panagrellus redivivus TaxID=6233 RepID=A0A7E4VKD7_PANRE
MLPYSDQNSSSIDRILATAFHFCTNHHSILIASSNPKTLSIDSDCATLTIPWNILPQSVHWPNLTQSHSSYNTSPATTTLILVSIQSGVLFHSVFPEFSTMPYPILTLPYPFAKRLPQLLSPLELQNLQIAAGRFDGQLKPDVLACNFDCAIFNGDTSDIITIPMRKVVKLHNNKIICNCEYVFFESLSNAVFENDHFNNTHYAASIVTMERCKVSTKFLENMAKKLTELTELHIEDESEVDKSIKFPTIFNLFPFCKFLAITTAYNGWVRDLVDASISTKIKRLTIEHGDLDELLSFDSDDIQSLLEQHSKMYMILTYKVPGPIQESEEYFESRFNKIFTLPKKFEGFDVYFFVKSMNTDLEPIDFCFVNGFV